MFSFCCQGSRGKKRKISGCEGKEDSSDDDGSDEDDEDSHKSGKRGEEKENIGKKSKTSWCKPEVEKFLDLCYEKHVMDKIDGLVGNNVTRVQIFTPVADALNKASLGKNKKNLNIKSCKSKTIVLSIN